MPLYEYKCHRCGKNFEKIQKFADEPLTVHEECGGEVERLISTPSFNFKGSGWYVTDYGKGGNAPAGSNGSSGDSNAKSESKSESKSDSKSDSKTETKSTPTKTDVTPAKSSDK